MIFNILKFSSFLSILWIIRKRKNHRIILNNGINMENELGNNILVLAKKRIWRIVSQSKKLSMLSELDSNYPLNINYLKMMFCFRKIFDLKYAEKDHVTVKKYIRLTPAKYDRHIFHLELDKPANIKYKTGDAIGIKPQNSDSQVLKLLECYKIPKDYLVKIKKKENFEINTIFKLLKYELDINCKLSQKFFYKLSKFAYKKYEKLKLHHLGTDDKELFRVLIHQGVTPYDILLAYNSSLKLVADDLVELLSKIYFRYYSIASSAIVHPNQIHLLIIVEDWKTTQDEIKKGFCSKFLSYSKN